MSRLEEAAVKGQEVEMQREEMQTRVLTLRRELADELDLVRDSARTEIQSDRRELDGLYALRDDQLAMLLHVQNTTVETEKQLQCEPFRRRRDTMQQGITEITSSLASRRDERRGLLDQIESFKIPVEIPAATIVHVPFWLRTLESGNYEQAEIFPPMSIRRLREPAKSSRNCVDATVHLSSSLTDIASSVVNSRGVIHEHVTLPLEDSKAAGVAVELDKLVSEQVITEKYSIRVKRYFNIQPETAAKGD